MEKDDDERKSIDACQRSHLDEKDIFKLTVAEKSPGKSSEEIGQDVLKRDPEKRSQQKDEFREEYLDFAEKVTEKCQKKRQEEDKDEIDKEA